MNFFHTIKHSVYGPSFYHGLRDKKFGSSLGSFVVLALILSLIFAVTGTIRYLSVKDEISKFITDAFDKYPSELVVTIKKGETSVNVQEPYFIKADAEDVEEGISNYVVIDTKSDMSLEKFKEYGTYAWLGKNNVMFIEDKGEIRAYSLKDIEFTLSKEKLAKWVGIALSFLPWLPFVIFMGMFAAYFIGIVFTLGYLLFLALLVWLVMHSKKIDWGYAKAYQVSLHAAVPALIIDLILYYLNVHVLFLFTGIFLVTVLVNLITWPASEEPAPAPEL
jgi:hypothetical protein